MEILKARQLRARLLVGPVCWSTDPTDPTLSKKQKNNIMKCWPTGFVLIYYFLLFEEKRNNT